MDKYQSYCIVFLASFILMVMEIVASRLVAPHIGASIYSWTSIIGVFLLGISLGNWFGGLVADRYHTQKLFGIIFIAAAISSVIVLFIMPLWSSIPKSHFGIPGLIILFSLITFFPVAFFLSFVSPMVIKLRLKQLEQTGRTVGNIYSVSTVGSILGTFLTGFYLIPSFGTKQIVYTIFIILILIGIYFIVRYHHKKYISLIVLLILTPVGLLAYNQHKDCDVESEYYCIKVESVIVKGTNEKGLALTLNYLQNNHLYSPSFDPFGDIYARLWAGLINYQFKPQDKFSILLIGGGAYILPRYVINNYPNATIKVLEIDPAVTKINFDKLDLKPNPRLIIINEDARIAMHQLGNEKFDFIFSDAFNDFSVPFHLTTKEFLQEIKTHLNPNGLYAMNLIDIPAKGRFLASSLNTVSSVFNYSYLFPSTEAWQRNMVRQTVTVMGTDQEFNDNRWLASAPYNDPRWKFVTKAQAASLKFYLSSNDRIMKDYLREQGAVVLTDDYAPVDNMIAGFY